MLGITRLLELKALLATLTWLCSCLLLVVRVRTLLFKRFVTDLAKLEQKKLRMPSNYQHRELSYNSLKTVAGIAPLTNLKSARTGEHGHAFHVYRYFLDEPK